jgi:hypothetical protein
MHFMDKTEDAYLLELRNRNICPFCGKIIPEGAKVIRGKGTFCSLDCVARYNEPEFTMRAQHLAEISRRQH